jgi:hypothetical protein
MLLERQQNSDVLAFSEGRTQARHGNVMKVMAKFVRKKDTFFG